MPTPTDTVCPRCRKPITVDYVRLGAAVDCPHCLQRTVPEVPAGGAFPASGYQIKYSDFLHLLADPDHRAAVAPLIAEWFGFQVEQSGPDTIVRGTNGVPVDVLWLHLQIQYNAARQERLYQAAMSLWR